MARLLELDDAPPAPAPAEPPTGPYEMDKDIRQRCVILRCGDGRFFEIGFDELDDRVRGLFDAGPEHIALAAAELWHAGMLRPHAIPAWMQ